MYSDEIASSQKLKALFWVFLVGFCFSLNPLKNRAINAANHINDFNYSCPSYFQNCDNIVLPTTLPFSWGSDIFYGFIIILLFFGAYFFYNGLYKRALQFLYLPTLLQFFITFFLANERSIPFEVFHTGFLIVFLFFPHKKFFLKIVFIVFYFCAGLMKLDDGWIAGSFFNSMTNGLPLIPGFLSSLATNLVIIFELFGVFLLFSSKEKYKKVVFYFFIIFHLYSAILVGIRYPVHSLLVLYLLFSDQESYIEKKFKKTDYAFFIYPFIILIINYLALSMGQYAKITFEGYRPAINMYDANRRCDWTVTTELIDGSKSEEHFTSNFSFERCNVYTEYFKIKNRCIANSNTKAIYLHFNASINGGPFLNYVNNINICEVSYNHLSNYWIANSNELDKQRLNTDLKYPNLNTPFRQKIDLTFHDKPQFRPHLSQKYVEVIRIFYIFTSLLALVGFFVHIHTRLKSSSFNVSNK